MQSLRDRALRVLEGQQRQIFGGTSVEEGVSLAEMDLRAGSHRDYSRLFAILKYR